MVWAPHKIMRKLIAILLLLPTLAHSNELMCLAKNIYHEARGEPEAAWFAVGFVTMNRVYDKRWPDSVCKVVYQPGQFIWTNKKQKRIRTSELFNDIIYVASIVIQSKEIEQYGVYFDKADHRPSQARLTIGFHEFYN